jgi:hypothetical protein
LSLLGEVVLLSSAVVCEHVGRDALDFVRVRTAEEDEQALPRDMNWYHPRLDHQPCVLDLDFLFSFFEFPVIRPCCSPEASILGRHLRLFPLEAEAVILPLGSQDMKEHVKIGWCICV